MTRLQAFISAKNTATDSAVFRSGRVRIVHPAAVVSKSSAFFGLFGHDQTTGQPQAPPSANRFPQSAKKKKTTTHFLSLVYDPSYDLLLEVWIKCEK